MNEIYEIILSNITQPIWGNWYIKGKHIGEGTFSRVYKIEAERFGRTDVSALKIEPVVADNIFFNEEQKKSFIERKKLLVKNESDIMYALRDCANIVRYEDESIKELYIDGNFEGYYFLMRMELLTPIPTLIKDKKMDFSEQNIIKLAKHIGQGIKAAHDRGFIHRDIKPANLFVSDEGTYKLGDFNVSKKNVTARSVAGADGYIAPEIYRINSDDSYTRQVDIYSFGICLYQFMNNFYFPFEEKGKVYTDTAIDRRMRGERFPKPENSSEEFGRIILRACEFDTSKRYKTIDEMLFDLENLNFSRPSESYISKEKPDLYDDNATQYAGEETSVNKDTSATQYAGEYYQKEDNVTDLYETNESNFEIENGVLIKYHGNAEYVKIPYGVTEIGKESFAHCKSLTSVIIPDSVITIGVAAFWECVNLTSIIIPDSVTEIDDLAFSICDNLTSIQVEKNNLNYSSINGVLFNNDMSELIKYPANRNESNYIIVDSVKKIRICAFDCCKNLTFVTIPDNVTEIGEVAFMYCKNLTSITIPKSVIEIGDEAFSDCKSLTSVTIPRCFENDIKRIFPNCPKVVISFNTFYETNKSDFRIIDNVLIKYRGISQYVKIPYSVTEIGFQAFEYCNSLTSVIIPDSVTKIDNCAFFCCESLISIQVEKNNLNYSSVNGVLFNNDMSELIKYPDNRNKSNYIIIDSVKKIGSFAFWDCKNLTSVTIPDSVTKIAYGAFRNCTNLTSVTIPCRFKKQIKKIFPDCPKIVISYTESEKESMGKKFKKLFGNKNL